MKTSSDKIRSFNDNYNIKEKNNTKVLLGKGGNAYVYLAVNGNGEEFALKCLYETNEKRKIKRFNDEIQIVQKIQSEIDGVIPILEFNVDYKDKKNRWYVMKLGTPLSERIPNNENPKEILDCIIDLSRTLKELHKRDIVHRDIKPSNLYYLNEKWCFSDFGLAYYPEKDNDRFTNTFEKIGNFSTIAPEMRRAGNIENSKPADVFSMAKTLWMMLTNSEVGFEGCYSKADKSIALSNFELALPIEPLEKLLINATSLEADERLSIEEFYDELVYIRELLLDQEHIYTTEQFEVLNKNNEMIYITSDREVEIKHLIKTVNLNIYSQETFYIDKGCRVGVDALKYIKYKLENNDKMTFIVSPIHTWSGGAGHFPRIIVWIKYKANTAKFVTNIVYYYDDKKDGSVEVLNFPFRDFECIEKNNDELQINFNKIEVIIKYICEKAYESRYKKG
jgi:serine/threonine protein kinase